MRTNGGKCYCLDGLPYRPGNGGYSMMWWAIRELSDGKMPTDPPSCEHKHCLFRPSPKNKNLGGCRCFDRIHEEYAVFEAVKDMICALRMKEAT